jgi:hypothetical protein
MANGVPENAVQEQPGLGGRERRAKRHRTTLASGLLRKWSLPGRPWPSAIDHGNAWSVLQAMEGMPMP